MVKNLSSYLEYFLKDILGENMNFKARKMFGSFGIFKNKKIFAIYNDGEIFFRKNEFTENLEQFFYEKKGQKIFLPYFKIDESLLENREKLEKWIKSSLDY